MSQKANFDTLVKHIRAQIKKYDFPQKNSGIRDWGKGCGFFINFISEYDLETKKAKKHFLEISHNHKTDILRYSRIYYLGRKVENVETFEITSKNLVSVRNEIKRFFDQYEYEIYG